MKMIAMPVWACSAFIRSRIWAWMVTSSAVVGSSQMSRAGSPGSAHGDHHPLAHAAGRGCGINRETLGRLRDPTFFSMAMAASRRWALCNPGGAGEHLHQLIPDRLHRD